MYSFCTGGGKGEQGRRGTVGEGGMERRSGVRRGEGAGTRMGIKEKLVKAYEYRHAQILISHPHGGNKRLKVILGDGLAAQV